MANKGDLPAVPQVTQLQGDGRWLMRLENTPLNKAALDCLHHNHIYFIGQIAIHFLNANTLLRLHDFKPEYLSSVVSVMKCVGLEIGCAQKIAPIYRDSRNRKRIRDPKIVEAILRQDFEIAENAPIPAYAVFESRTPSEEFTKISQSASKTARKPSLKRGMTRTVPHSQKTPQKPNFTIFDEETALPLHVLNNSHLLVEVDFSPWDRDLQAHMKRMQIFYTGQLLFYSHKHLELMRLTPKNIELVDKWIHNVGLRPAAVSDFYGEDAVRFPKNKQSAESALRKFFKIQADTTAPTISFIPNPPPELEEPLALLRTKFAQLFRSDLDLHRMEPNFQQMNAMTAIAAQLALKLKLDKC